MALVTTEDVSLDKRLRVLHLVSGDLWAGAEVQVKNLVSAQLKRTDIIPSVIVLNPGRLMSELRGMAVAVTLIDEAGHSSLSILWGLIHQLRKDRPDLIHTHRLKENVIGSIAAFFAGGIPSLRTVHGLEENPPLWYRLDKRFYRWTDRLCALFLQDKVVAVSTDIAERLRHQFPERLIEVVVNGIDLESDVLQTARRRSRLRKSATSPRVGIIGRLVPVKRVDLFIDISRAFTDAYPEIDAVFCIYGDGPQRNELESYAMREGVQTNLRFFGHIDSIYDEMVALDALIMTSDHEGLPMTLLEAMALDVPIIARNVGGIPEVLDNGRFGQLIDSSDPADYIRAIRTTLRSQDQNTKYTENVQSWLESRFSSNSCAKKYQAVYTSVRTT